VDGATQAEVRDALAARAVDLAEQAGPAGRVVILIAGSPGSGKSTFASGVAARISAALPPGPGAPPHGGGAGPRPASAVVLPMDGFHYSRAQLDGFPDPAAAHARRGAPWTFDAGAFVAAVRAAAPPGASLDAPTFDHGAGDPAPGGVVIQPWHRVLLVEGNYVLLDEAPWSELAPLATERWFLGCPLDTAMARVFARQRRQGRPREVVAARIAGNDRPNAELVNASAARADVVARSDLPARGSGSGSGSGSSGGGKSGGGGKAAASS
jgi:pantothenate kinase